MKRTINEIYEIIKLHKDELLNLLDENIKDTRDKVFNDIRFNQDIDMNEYYDCLNNTGLLKVKIDLYEDILNLIEESEVLEKEKIKNREDNEDEKVEILVEGYGTETDHIEGNGTISEGARTEGKPIEYYDIESREN